MTSPPYDHGFRSLERTTELESLPIEGKLPLELRGSLIRTGPALFEVNGKSFRHWFDGLAMLHRFSFAAGKVSYANRFLQSRSYLEAHGHRRISVREFATDPCQTIFSRFRNIFFPELTENANVNIAKIADHYVALTETPLPMRFDPETLETLGLLKFKDQIGGQWSSAHPLYDGKRKTIFSHATHFGLKTYYEIFKMACGSISRQLLARIPIARPAYIHSFGMTDHFLILCEFPLVVHPLALKFSNRPFIENFCWQPQQNVRFLVIDKNNGAVVCQSESETFFAFHHVNAFERDGEIVLDIVGYPDARIIDDLYLERLRQADLPIFSAKLRRFRLKYQGSVSIRSEDLHQTGIELPRINEAGFNMKPHRYVYGIGNQHFGRFPDQLVKIDLETQDIQTWKEDGCFPGEPIFVLQSQKREDSGFILSVVFDGRSQKSFLLVLNAETFTEIARAKVPHHIPFGFHGQYFE